MANQFCNESHVRIHQFFEMAIALPTVKKRWFQFVCFFGNQWFLCKYDLLTTSQTHIVHINMLLTLECITLAAAGSVDRSRQ